MAVEAPLLRVRQVHGADVLVRRAGERDDGDAKDTAADIIVTDDSSVALAIQTADCVPILIVDRRTGAVAAAHAGWRGLAAGVPRIAVDTLVRELGSRPADLIAAAGPSIGACCYEVGSDVRERFAEAGWQCACVGPMVFRGATAESGKSVDGGRAGKTRRPLVLRQCSRRPRPARVSGRAGRSDFPRRPVHGEPPRCVLLVSSRWNAGRSDGRGHHVRPAASSIAAFARRSACAFSARPTCSNVTRPISCTSSRAFACSGCRPGMLDLEAAKHLLHQQQRVGAHVQLLVSVQPRPLERGQQSAILRDVVRGGPDRLRELFDQRAVRLFDTDAVAGRSGVPACAAVDVRNRPSVIGLATEVAASLGGLRNVIGCGRSRGRHGVQDSLAAVALNDLIVPEHGVEDLRPQADVADRADAVAGLGHADAVAAARHELEDRERVRH